MNKYNAVVAYFKAWDNGTLRVECRIPRRHRNRAAAILNALAGTKGTKGEACYPFSDGRLSLAVNPQTGIVAGLQGRRILSTTL